MPYKDPEKQKQATHESYLRNKPRIRVDSKRRKAEKRELVARIKESTPCSDCNQYFPACVMDFDHIENNKDFSVSQLYGSTLERLMLEVNKCELVCANCHRLRTNSRRSI